MNLKEKHIRKASGPRSPTLFNVKLHHDARPGLSSAPEGETWLIFVKAQWKEDQAKTKAICQSSAKFSMSVLLGDTGHIRCVQPEYKRDESETRPALLIPHKCQNPSCNWTFGTGFDPLWQKNIIFSKCSNKTIVNNGDQGKERKYYKNLCL